MNEESVDTAPAYITLAELTDVRVEPKVMAPVNVLTVYRRTPVMIKEMSRRRRCIISKFVFKIYKIKLHR